MRVVRVSEGAIDPSEPIDTGSAGTLLRRSYEYANDGTRSENAATIVNNQPEDLESAVFKFRMDADHVPYEVDAGELFQTVVEGSVATCYVRVVAPSYSITPVVITPQQGSGIEDTPKGLSMVRPSHPNPAGGEARVLFSLPREAPVLVEIFDVSGRRVRNLGAELRSPGTHSVSWDLRDERGSFVASGIYLWRIASGEAVLQSKCAVLR